MRNSSINFQKDLAYFNTTYRIFESHISKIGVHNNLGQQLQAHLKHTINYNVFDGKHMRGGLTYSLTKACCEVFPETLKIDDIHDVVIITAWCVEMLQGLFLVLDDVMDHSSLRRNKPCWYTMKDIGLMAINDAFMMECCMYDIIEKALDKHPKVTEILSIFRKNSFNTTQGQYYDMALCSNAKNKNYANFTFESYETTNEYKTSYYSFILPLQLAFLLSNTPVNPTSLHALNFIYDLFILLGIYFQIQDDYLDLYGDKKTTGKSSTDIIDGKCTWFAVKALQLCQHEQREVFINNYASDDPTKYKTIIELYSQLDMINLYNEHQHTRYVNATQKLSTEIVPGSLIFNDLLYQVFIFIKTRQK